MPLDKRTVTEKRVASNRAAALKSTGPKTEEGKLRSAFNSFQHGLFSTQDSTLRRAMSRAGHDPAAYDGLYQDLAHDWQPEGAQQTLLVEDLTRLYWLKNLQQHAQIEWQARQGEHFRVQQKLNRNIAERNHLFSVDVGNSTGWRYAELGAFKFDGIFKCLGQIEEKVNRADLDEESANDIFRALYHHRPNQAGRAMKDLFQQGRKEKAKAGGELAQQLKALIEQERESAREEQRLWEEQCELERNLPLNDEDPALQPLSETWRELIAREARMDRQINAKVRLLIRLKTPPRGKKTASNPAPGGADDGLVTETENVLADSRSVRPPEAGGAQSLAVQELHGRCSPGGEADNDDQCDPDCGLSSHDKPTAISQSQMTVATASSNIKIEQTKPTKPLESTLDTAAPLSGRRGEAPPRLYPKTKTIPAEGAR